MSVCHSEKLKQRQQATKQAVRVAAKLALKMQENVNAQVRLPPAMGETMLYIKKERINVNASSNHAR
jgi:hypothetical protein